MNLFWLKLLESRRQFGTQALDRYALGQDVVLSFGGTKSLKFCIAIEQIRMRRGFLGVGDG
jgi:hypothetical protein